MKKDIKKSLEYMQPTRQLDADFTANTLAKIKPRNKNRFIFAIFRKSPALATIATIVLLSGGVYAAFHWPEITATFDGETNLPNGNRVIGVDTTNCNYFQVHNKPVPSKGTVYYEIKRESSLTQEQIVEIVKGTCEADRANSAVNNIVPSKVLGMTGGVQDIKAISKDSITVQLNKYYQDQKFTFNDQISYRKFAPNLLVYDGYQPIKYSDLKPGDNVILVAKDEHALASESDPTDGNRWDDPGLITILAIVKVPSPTASASAFYSHLGNDFVRTEPCNTDPSGFCRAYNFQGQ
jgi:hypothetical protein